MARPLEKPRNRNPTTTIRRSAAPQIRALENTVKASTPGKPIEEKELAAPENC